MVDGSLGEIAWFQILLTWDDYWKTATGLSGGVGGWRPQSRKWSEAGKIFLFDPVFSERQESAGCIQTRQCNEDINILYFIYIYILYSYTVFQTICVSPMIWKSQAQQTRDTCLGNAWASCDWERDKASDLTDLTTIPFFKIPRAWEHLVCNFICQLINIDKSMWLQRFHHTSSVERQVGKERFQIGWPTFWIYLYLGMTMYDIPFGTPSLWCLKIPNGTGVRLSPSWAPNASLRAQWKPISAIGRKICCRMWWRSWDGHGWGCQAPENHGGFASKDGERFNEKTKGFSQPKMVGNFGWSWMWFQFAKQIWSENAQSSSLSLSFSHSLGIGLWSGLAPHSLKDLGSRMRTTTI